MRQGVTAHLAHDVSKQLVFLKVLMLLHYKKNLYSCHEDDKKIALIVSVIIGFHALFDSESGEGIIFN